MKKPILMIWLFLSLFCYSQEDNTDSTITKKKIEFFPKRYGDKNWKILFGFDARRSFFEGTKVKINGIKVGAELWGVHRFGNGFYWLQKNVVFHETLLDHPDQDFIDPEIHFSLGYTSIFYERVFIKSKWWDISFPLHLAAGSITGTYRDTLGGFPQFVSRPFSALIPAFQVKFYPLSWLAVRVSGGYKLVFNTQPEVKKAFRTVYYGYGISINPVELYRTIFKKKNKIKKSTEENELEEENGDGEERR